MTSQRAGLQNACKEYEEDSVLYYYGDTGEEDRRRIAEHLSLCERCRLFVDDLSRLLPRMAEVPKLPQSFWDSYYRETVAKLEEQEERRNRWRSCWAPLRGWMVPAFGTAAGMILVVGLLFGKGHLDSFLDPHARQIPREIIADSNQLEFFRTMDMLESLEKLEQQDGAGMEKERSRSSFA